MALMLKDDQLEKVVRVLKRTNIQEILDELKIKEDRLCIFINDNFYQTLRLDHQLYAGDIVKILPELKGGGGRGVKLATTLVSIGALVATGGLGASGALTGTQLFVARAGVLIGAQFLILGIQRVFGRRLQQEQLEASQTPNYGLDAGSNRSRPLEPFPLIMGEFLFSPDISSKPYNEPVNILFSTPLQNVGGWNIDIDNQTIDQSTFLGTGIINVGGQDFQYTHPLNSGTPDDWFRRIPFGSYHPTLQEAKDNPVADAGDIVHKTYVWITDSLINDPATRERYVEWEDLIANGLSANFIDPAPATTIDVLRYIFSINNLVDTSVPVYALKQIFNYGFGDLTIENLRIGQTEATLYQEFSEYDNTQTPTNYPLAQQEPEPLQFPVVFNSEVNGNVYTVEGGELYSGLFIERESPDNIFAIHIDITGKQFRTNPNVPTGVEFITRIFQFQYREVGDPTWIDFPTNLDGLNPNIITTATYNFEYKETVYVENLPLGKYEIRCRKVSPEETDPNNVCQFFVSQIRFYKSDINQIYECQNRKGVIVEASSQINGTLANFSSIVKAKCWKWNGVDYDWDFTENPADWFLYFARGGYKNTSADGTFTYPFSPTIGWVNSADHPDNGEKLFGCGYSDSRIDFQAIQDWWQYCDDNNLTFNGVLTTRRNTKEVLEEIATAGRGSPNFTLGKLAVIWEEPTQPTVAVFTPDNIIKDSFQISYINQKVPDRIVCEFINRNDNYAQDEVFADMPTVSNIIDIATVQLWGTVTEDQAQRACNLLVSRNLYNKRLITFKTDAEGLIVSRGDVISISHDMTQWGFSGRIKEFVLLGGFVTAIKSDVPLDALLTSVTVRDPFNNINTYDVIVSIDGFWFEIQPSTPWVEANAPRYINQQGAENLASIFPDSWHDDFIFLSGFADNGGKKCRIKEINPVNTNEVEIVATDEELAYYAREFGGAYVPPEDYELIKAIVFNPAVEFNELTQRVYWEKDGCDAVSVLIQVNGGGYNPFISPTGATIFSNFIDLSFVSGDVVDIIISPVLVGVPYDQVDATLTYEVP